MKNKIAKTLLLVGALIATFTALAHLSCIVLGSQCYKLQLAPEVIVESAIQGTWLAPIAAILISFLFFTCAVYALSKAGIIRRLPLLNIGVYTIATIAITRGLLTFQLKLRHPELVDFNNFAYGLIWFIAGLLFLLGGQLKSD